MQVTPENVLLDPGFQLFETMRVTRDQRVRHLDSHLVRLERSAVTLAFRFDRARLMAALDEALTRVAAGVTSRLRLALAHDGGIDIWSETLPPLPDGRVDLLIESKPVAGARLLAHHKTTLRAAYDAGVRRAELRGAYDSLFFAADGRMVEGGRSNVFVLLDGRW